MIEGVRQLLNSFITLRCYLLSLKIMIWFQLAVWHLSHSPPIEQTLSCRDSPIVLLVFRFSILKEVVLILVLGFPGASGVKNPPAMSSIRKIPWRRKCQRTLVFLPREFHGQRSLAGHSPWGRDLETKQQATTHSYLTNTSFSLLSPTTLTDFSCR